MTAALGLVFIVGIAYFAAHVVFEWLGRRFRIVSGAEYLVLGILLGPQVSGFMSRSVVQSFAPFMTLALGWVGVVLGMKFYLPDLIRIRANVYKIALTESVLTFAFVSVIMTVGLAWTFDVEYAQVVLPAIALGAIATATAPAPTLLLGTGSEDPVVQQLDVTSLLDGAVAIIAFGVLLAVVHIDVRAGQHLITATEWTAITLGIGVVAGILFHLFIGSERDPDRLFIALSGSIILASGAAAFLRISPLLPALVIGAILANTSINRQELERMLQTLERPLYYVLLLFAGAAWRPSHIHNWIMPVALYVLVRAIGKLGSARLAARIMREPNLVEADWGHGLLGQGTIALAIAMSYSLNDTTLVPNMVFTAAIVSVLFADFFGVRVINALVRRSSVS